jgi:hypothetical protein
MSEMGRTFMKPEKVASAMLGLLVGEKELKVDRMWSEKAPQ